MSVGIIYSTVNKILRRWVVPDSDVELTDANLLLPGESLLIVSNDEYAKGPNVEAIMQNHGITPGNPVCAVVSGGVVVSVICADPLLDTVPGRTIQAAPTAVVGQLISGSAV